MRATEPRCNLRSEGAAVGARGEQYGALAHVEGHDVGEDSLGHATEDGMGRHLGGRAGRVRVEGEGGG